MDIDKRLEALTQSLEILTVNTHELQDSMQKAEERLEKVEERQTRATDALLGGIMRYLQIMRGENGEGGGKQ